MTDQDTQPVELVTAATFDSYVEAIVAKASLEAAGIHCCFPNENMVRIGDIDPTSFSSGLRLLVAAQNADAARQVLTPVD